MQNDNIVRLVTMVYWYLFNTRLLAWLSRQLVYFFGVCTSNLSVKVIKFLNSSRCGQAIEITIIVNQHTLTNYCYLAIFNHTLPKTSVLGSIDLTLYSVSVNHNLPLISVSGNVLVVYT